MLYIRFPTLDKLLYENILLLRRIGNICKLRVKGVDVEADVDESNETIKAILNFVWVVLQNHKERVRHLANIL